MVLQRNITIDREKIAEFCRRHRIRRLLLFGSVLRDDFRPDSDVDVLVEFEPGKTPGFEFVTMADELEEMLGRKVDFLTGGFFKPTTLARVMQEAEEIYSRD